MLRRSPVGSDRSGCDGWFDEFAIYFIISKFIVGARLRSASLDLVQKNCPQKASPGRAERRGEQTASHPTDHLCGFTRPRVPATGPRKAPPDLFSDAPRPNLTARVPAGIPCAPLRQTIAQQDPRFPPVEAFRRRQRLRLLRRLSKSVPFSQRRSKAT